FIRLIVIALFVGLPFIDRRPERRPWKRPLTVGVFALVFFSLVALGALSYRDDHGDPGVVKQLAKQREETEQFMRAPFEPERMGASLADAAPADPLVTAGEAPLLAPVFSPCHGQGGRSH